MLDTEASLAPATIVVQEPDALELWFADVGVAVATAPAATQVEADVGAGPAAVEELGPAKLVLLKEPQVSDFEAKAIVEGEAIAEVPAVAPAFKAAQRVLLPDIVNQ